MLPWKLGGAPIGLDLRFLEDSLGVGLVGWQVPAGIGGIIGRLEGAAREERWLNA